MQNLGDFHLQAHWHEEIQHPSFLVKQKAGPGTFAVRIPGSMEYNSVGVGRVQPPDRETLKI